MKALQYVLTSFNIDVVLGNFNINYFSQTHSSTLRSLMESLNYSQIVTEPTFVSAGSLLDHVYVKPINIFTSKQLFCSKCLLFGSRCCCYHTPIFKITISFMLQM